MKTNLPSSRPALQADPRIVKKARRDSADYAPFGGLLGEQVPDYLHQPNRGAQAPRPLEFGRPGL